MKTRHLLLAVLLLGGIYSTQAATYKAIASGNWSDNIWNQPGFPGSDDDVIINGFFVTIQNNVIAEAKSITLTNSDGLTNITRLEINSAQLTIQEQFTILSDQNTSPALSHNINLTVNSATIEVHGDIIITKAALDSSLGSINIETSGNSEIHAFKNMILEFNSGIGSPTLPHKLSLAASSELIVKGDFTSNVYDNNTFDFSFTEVATLMADQDLILNSYEDAIIKFSYNSSATTSTIANNFQLNSAGTNGGLNSEINLNAGTLNVNGDLTLSSDDPSQVVRLHLDGTQNSLNVDGKVQIDARDQNTISIIMDQTSTLEVGSSIERATPYGNLLMQPTSLLVFNFDTFGTLPTNNSLGSNTDQFQFSNVKLINNSGSPVQLDGPMVLDFNLELSNGIIETDSLNIIILQENATITGANENSYIDGPIEKRGISNQPILIPLGNKGIYAPLEISPITDPNSIFRLEFFGDPPPIGGVPPDLDQINEDQHWIMDRIAGPPVDMIMHWQDGHESGMANMPMDSITTVYLNTATNEWVNTGRGTVTGSNGSGEAGSISSDLLGDPPPIGAVAVTIGTVSTNSVLPVELLTFKAKKEDNAILLNWVTASEIDFSHFELERSTDGIEFTKIGSKTAIGGETQITNYIFRDKLPTLGTNYYRLKSVDLDGSESISRVLSIRFENVDTPVAVPNPVREQLLIMGLNLASNQVYLEIFNASGQVLFQQSMEVNDGKIEIQMQNVNISSEGTYYLRVVDDARTHNITILKN